MKRHKALISKLMIGCMVTSCFSNVVNVAYAADGSQFGSNSQIDYVYESSKPDLSILEELKKERLMNTDDIKLIDMILSSEKDDQIYEYLLGEKLNIYYQDPEKYDAQISLLAETQGEKADSVFARYNAAAEERAQQSSLNYDADTVIVSFDSHTTDTYIADFIEDNTRGYKVLFDGTFDVNPNLPDEKAEDLNKRLAKLQSNSYDKIYAVQINLDQTTDLAIEELANDQAVKSVSKDYCEHVEAGSSADPYSSLQDYLDTVNVDDAYPIFDNGYVEPWIAILDDGIDMQHQDLSANLLSNFCYDTVEDELLMNCSTKYTGSHGTKVAGIIGAVSGNNKGIMGVTSGYGDNFMRFMMVKVTDSDDNAYVSEFISGIEYAVEAGATVINISYGGPNYILQFQDMINYATDCDVTIVAAAGNDGDKGNPTNYPAAYDNVISVAAVDSSNVRAYFSNYGDTIDIAAPGMFLYTTDLNNTYTFASGTSFAAPIVTAGVAMLKAFAADKSTANMEQIIEYTATDINDPDLGAGLINIGLAMEYTRRLEFVNYQPVLVRVTSGAARKATVRARITRYNTFAPKGFQIFRSTSLNGTYTRVKTVSYDDSFGSSTWDVVEWTDTGLTSNKTYYYKVRCNAKYGSGQCYSQFSNIISVKVL